MQLSRHVVQRIRSALLLLETVVVVLAAVVEARGASDADAPVHMAAGASSAPTKGAALDPPALEDGTIKTASMEFATYTDTDHVTVVTPSIAVGVENVDGASLHGTYLVDVVSAASADVVSSASPRWREVRQAGSLAGDYKPRDLGIGLGASVSSEPDYLSYGASARVTKDFDQKNWTLFFGYGFSHDTIGRCGVNGACTPFSVFSRSLERGALNGGLDVVLDRRSLASVAGDLIVENGDQSKPYRYVPMFAPDIAERIPRGASIGLVNQVRLPEKPLEQLPLSRRRFAVTGRYAHRFDGSTLRVEERLYDDSWGLIASSLDVRWILDLSPRLEFWPHGRFHAQDSVTFWQRAYASGPAGTWNLPEYRTGDRELGPLWTVGGGLGLKVYLGTGAALREWALQLTGDTIYTSFLDDLYLTSRTAFLGALAVEGQL